jgi:ribosomal-protein-alanine acetyltransferase
VKIRKATRDDIRSMMNIALESAFVAHWTSNQYEDLFFRVGTITRLALVADAGPKESTRGQQEGSGILGFLIARQLAPEWELENMAVTSNARGKGIGKQLLQALITEARKTDSESVILEVRESNSVARGLYEDGGFSSNGRRKSYYSNPIEDAILYVLALR